MALLYQLTSFYRTSWGVRHSGESMDQEGGYTFCSRALLSPIWPRRIFTTISHLGLCSPYLNTCTTMRVCVITLFPNTKHRLKDTIMYVMVNTNENHLIWSLLILNQDHPKSWEWFYWITFFSLILKHTLIFLLLLSFVIVCLQ